jgi:CRP/FNR family nitrogen fixation transcriptional regulator
MLHWRRSEASPANGFPLAGHSHDDESGAAADAFQLMGARIRYDRNAEIFGEDEPAEYLYRVVSGAVRVCKLMSDGRRQIGAFYLPGDLFGLEADDFHRFSAEAICDSEILVVKRAALMARSPVNGPTIAEMWVQTMSHLRQAQNHMLLLGRKTAQERIAAFLLEMGERSSRSGALELPMCRQDIADYLGLTIETVSRTLTQLEREGVISIPVSRRIVVRDRAVLDELNDCLAA